MYMKEINLIEIPFLCSQTFPSKMKVNLETQVFDVIEQFVEHSRVASFPIEGKYCTYLELTREMYILSVKIMKMEHEKKPYVYIPA